MTGRLQKQFVPSIAESANDLSNKLYVHRQLP